MVKKSYAQKYDTSKKKVSTKMVSSTMVSLKMVKVHTKTFQLKKKLKCLHNILKGPRILEETDLKGKAPRALDRRCQ